MAETAKQQKRRRGRQQHREARRPNNEIRRTEQSSEPSRRKLALALQGGGSHGAFTWGVLDRLLDDATIDIIGVTGTSAGAMSGAILADGLVGGGAAQARAKLRRYWEAVGATPGFGSFFSGISGEEAANTALESIPACAEKMRQNLSPYDQSPSNSTLHLLLSELIDFDRLRLQNKIQLTICATNARTAKRRVFTNHDASFDVLLASTCLPQYFRAVEIDGEAYWDGGWTGNPALAPLLTKMPE
jgi:NTE family protein